MMAVIELRRKTEKELSTMLTEFRADLEKLHWRKQIADLDNLNLLRSKRRDIARILTILKEKEVLRKIAPLEVGQ